MNINKCHGCGNPVEWQDRLYCDRCMEELYPDLEATPGEIHSVGWTVIGLIFIAIGLILIGLAWVF